MILEITKDIMLLTSLAYSKDIKSTWNSNQYKRLSLKSAYIPERKRSKCDTISFISTQYIGKLVIAFRGTNNIPNLIQNLKYYNSNFNGAKVHTGLLQNFYSLKQELDDVIHVYPGSQFIFTGHSSGNIAAFATIYCWFNHRRPNMHISHFSFGSPKLGDGSFLKLYNSIPLEYSIRMVLDTDPIPLLPLDSNWIHVGKEVKKLKRPKRFYNIEDHLMEQYIDATYIN